MSRFCLFLFLFFISSRLFAQSNSPYSRFGLGDISSSANVTGRSMGGISAGYADWYSVNFNNPASYSQFLTYQEQRSKKIASGRVVFDVGTNLESRTLIAPNTPNRFTSTDLSFSYLQVGLPLKKNWGLSFGIRPLSRISYLINDEESLLTSTGDILPLQVQYRGSGGSFLPTIGTGFAIKNLSLGVNAGYLFGSRESTTFKIPVDDSLVYVASEHTTNTSLGGLFFNAGLQYAITLNKNTVLRLGVAGNWKQNINGSQDMMRQTFTRGAAGEELRIDSVFERNGVKGEIVYPSSYKAGFIIQNSTPNKSGWLFGLDYSQNKWSEYRFFGQADSVQDNWMVNFGAQLSPRPGSNYFSNVAYRFGFFTGKDHIKVRNELPVFGASFGMAFPLAISRMAPNQISMINVGLEYTKRGNNDNLLKENLFRFSLGLNLTDLWFGKRKYE